ncbi:DUF3592 domain-containing protein [Stieleria varia]|uniref:DUF3592 domain-containing protein n=1 Tax=Stieleria varia TaxID=2528005 RepID=A0A5C6ASX4_9BACT|nr:DUF3592 domain-containing protein [Stieleria varia]TWU02527.1 hypothetical protein Pla52n_35770 [Stieleria varia]
MSLSDQDTTPGRPGWYRIITCFLTVTISLGACIYTTYHSWILVSRGERATATVTKIETVKVGTDNLDSPIWHVKFPTANGQSRQATIDASFSRVKVGDTINVLYDPTRTDQVLADRWISLWGWPAASAFLFFCFLGETFRLSRDLMMSHRGTTTKQ